MTQAERRWIALDGTRNCRDFGGIRVADGLIKFDRLFRSDALHLLSDQDQVLLGDLSLKAIIDLRVDFEKNKAPNQLAPDLAKLQLDRSFLPNRTHKLFEMVNKGELDGAATRRFMLQQYRVLTLEHIENYQSVFKDILTLGKGILFHCTSGKDRTGLMSALILAALGATEEQIVADYVLTNGRIDPISFLNDSVAPEVTHYIMAAEADYIVEALKTMQNEYGSIDKYLSGAMLLNASDRDRLREILVD
jgi:protein-tyrosine phosphatase